ncbi:VanZ family protein [Paenibacillus sp. N10]|uniref:VanZ family protein n=2 Tax=Paenibacillus lutrae TaxID=2078573 RepID=A0A7X3JY06_9BACL|nr:VanZ family protein [Paenibacillus lutrae]MVO98445.1 VanZ family protein [Paenibacillus lutrae]
MAGKTRSRAYWWWFAAAIGWMIVIFVKSAESYQDQDMRPFFRDLIPEEVIVKWVPQVEFTYDGGLVTWREPYDFVEFFIRKGAHMAEFGILVFLFIRMFLARRLPYLRTVLLASALSVLYAASDEWHQSFVPNRTGHAIDVAVDTLGILLVVTVYSAVRFLRRRGRTGT